MTSKRGGRSVNLILALLIYVVYSNCMSMVQAWVVQGRVGIAAGKFYVDHTDTKAHRHLHRDLAVGRGEDGVELGVESFEIVRRLGDHTKLLRRMTDDIAAIRAESQSNNATDG